jgi:ferredoxin
MTRPSEPEVRVAVDRVACTGHGLCAQLLPTRVTLDEWAYPVLEEGSVTRAGAVEAAVAVRLCPARALRVVDAPDSGGAVRERRT